MDESLILLSGPEAAAFLPQVAKLQLAAISELHALTVSGFGNALAAAPTLDELEERFRTALAEGALLYIAVSSGEFAGFLQGFVEDYSDDLVDAPYMTIEYLAVAPAFRGAGIAHRLLQLAEREALARGCTALELRVMAGNSGAIAAYQRYGFELLELRYARLLNGLVAAGQDATGDA